MGFDMHMVSHAMDMGLDTSLLRHDDISLTAKCIIWVGGEDACTSEYILVFDNKECAIVLGSMRDFGRYAVARPILRSRRSTIDPLRRAARLVGLCLYT